MGLIAEFQIFGLPKTVNAIGRKHWGAKHTEATKWRKLIAEKCALHHILNLKLTKAILTLTRHSSKAPDYDGLVSSFKQVIDPLVRCGVIIDDNYTVIGAPTYHWVKRPNKQGGMISIRIEV